MFKWLKSLFSRKVVTIQKSNFKKRLNRLYLLSGFFKAMLTIIDCQRDLQRFNDYVTMAMRSQQLNTHRINQLMKEHANALSV